MATARRAHGFGMEVSAVDLSPVSVPTEVHAVRGLDRLDDLLSLSDWFVVAAPLTPRTRGLIGPRRLALLKPTAHLIVDEDALIEAPRGHRLAGAGY